MTLNCYKFQFSENLAGFRRFGRQQPGVYRGAASKESGLYSWYVYTCTAL